MGESYFLQVALIEVADAESIWQLYYQYFDKSQPNLPVQTQNNVNTASINVLFYKLRGCIFIYFNI